MRIAIFTETYLPYINGVVTHVKILKEGLEHKGHQVLVVTADVNAKEHYIDEDNILRCPALEFKKIYNYGVAVPINITRQRMIQEFNPDVIHIHNEFGISLAGVRASRALKIPLIYTLHTMYDEYIYYIAPKPLTGIAKNFSHQYIRFLARRADALTGPSKKCEDYFRMIGITKPFHLIPNSVEVDDFGPGASTLEERLSIRERYGIGQDEFVACFVGRIGKEKGIGELLGMWKEQITREDKMRLLVVGDGPFREEFEKESKELGISDMVTFTGAIPHPELPPYYATCDVYLTASLSEMYSISMLEGMASGLAAIQLLDPENKDQITPGVNGYLYESAPQMANYLRMIRDKSPEERAALRQSVMESVKERSSDGIANYMLDIYEKAIEKKKRERR